MPDFSRKHVHATFPLTGDHKEQERKSSNRRRCRRRTPAKSRASITLMLEEPIMQIQVSGHQIEITPALRDYVDSRRERLARRFDHLTSLNVVLEVEKNPQANRAEGTLSAAGTVLHANAVDADMYAAIDALFDKLDAQVRRHKDKRRTHGRDDIRDLA
jgi:putative sigma-54 modulation protein